MNLSSVVLLANTTGADPALAPKASPSILSYFIVAALALLGSYLMYMKQRSDKRLDKQDESLALVNQALAVLVSQINPVLKKMDEHDRHLTELDVSAAVLKQALEAHIISAAAGEARLSAEINSRLAETKKG